MQAHFNTQVQESVQEAQGAFATIYRTHRHSCVPRRLWKKVATRLLVEKQKVIKIADRSANGWRVVAEYTADELADDSDDEKRLEKAEKAAVRKVHGAEETQATATCAQVSPTLSGGRVPAAIPTAAAALARPQRCASGRCPFRPAASASCRAKFCLRRDGTPTYTGMA